MSASALNRINGGAHAMAAGCVVTLGLSLPVSTALDSVLLGLLLVGFLLSGDVRQKLRAALLNPAALTLLVFFGLVALGMTYGRVPMETRLGALKDYLPLALVLLFLPLFTRQSVRVRALIAFGAVMAFTLVLSLLLAAGWLPEVRWLKGIPENPVVFKERITHSVFLAFAAFLFATVAARDTVKWRRFVLFGLAALTFVDVLFLVQGRTGQIVLLVLAFYFLVQRFGWRGVMPGVLVAGIALLSAWHLSEGFRDRLVSTVVEARTAGAGVVATEEHSTGLRVEWYRNTARIIAENPWFGVGTGGFQQAYGDRVIDPAVIVPAHPHNQYLLVAAEQGLPAAIVLVLGFVWLWRLARRIPEYLERSLARALLLTIGLGCLFNSLLIDHAEGLFFAWMMSLTYARVGSMQRPQA
jgi:O-antigen ligase